MNAFFLLLAPLAGWVSLFSQARHYWGEGSYYSYGWAVPFLALALATRKLRAPGLETTVGRVSRFQVTGLISLLLILTPLRLVAEPDPYWRLPLWCQAVALVVLTLVVLRITLGSKAPRAFLFPCLFLLTALPWPTGAESALVYTLSGWVMAIDAEILLLCGKPAEMIGDVIQVSGQRIEIDATCSGIRSFQCLLAFGLFFGEYFRLGWIGRGAVAVAGLAFAFGFNLCRALVLSFVIISTDLKTYDTWHDPVGYTAIVLAFLGLVGFARFVSSFGAVPARAEEPARFGHVRPPLAWLCVLLAILPEAATQAWFRYGVSKHRVPDWTIDWTALDEDKLQFLPFRKTTLDALLFDHGKRCILELPDGNRAEIFFYEYDGSRPSASVCSRHHNPSICMSATEAELIGGDKFSTIKIGEASLRFIHYVTGSPDQFGQYPTHAFWCPWTPDPRSGAVHFENLPRSERLRAFFFGRMDYARKVLLVVFTGNRRLEDAQTALRDLMDNSLRSVQEE